MKQCRAAGAQEIELKTNGVTNEDQGAFTEIICNPEHATRFSLQRLRLRMKARKKIFLRGDAANVYPQGTCAIPHDWEIDGGNTFSGGKRKLQQAAEFGLLPFCESAARKVFMGDILLKGMQGQQ